MKPLISQIVHVPEALSPICNHTIMCVRPATPTVLTSLGPICLLQLRLSAWHGACPRGAGAMCVE